MTDRRRFVTSSAGVAAGAVAAASSFPAPAIAQSAPEIHWRCASSFPKSLDTIYGGGEVFAKALSEATDGKFQVQVFAAGEIVPAFQTLDAVGANTVECTHTASYYFFGKDPTFAFGAAMPFGLNYRLQNAWLYQGGGMELVNNFYKKHNVLFIPCGNSGAQMGGWFRNEVKTVADLSGLKMRIAGLGGVIMSKLGAVPQQIAGGDIYPALEKGTIDAAEFVGPYDDEKLGFQKIAKFYYYPGWWEAGPTFNLFINLEQYEKLPAGYKAAVQNAAAVANHQMVAKYDVVNPQALRRLLAAGVQLRPFTGDLLQAAYAAANEVYAGYAAENPDFKAIYEPWQAFRNDGYLWWQVCESTMDSFMIRARSQAAKG